MTIFFFWNFRSENGSRTQVVVLAEQAKVSQLSRKIWVSVLFWVCILVFSFFLWSSPCAGWGALVFFWELFLGIQGYAKRKCQAHPSIQGSVNIVGGSAKLLSICEKCCIVGYLMYKVHIMIFVLWCFAYFWNDYWWMLKTYEEEQIVKHGLAVNKSLLE